MQFEQVQTIVALDHEWRNGSCEGAVCSHDYREYVRRVK